MPVVLAPSLSLLSSLLPEDDFGACERSSVRTLWAVEVSPEFNALVKESSAVDSGLESEEVEEPLVVFELSEGG